MTAPKGMESFAFETYSFKHRWPGSQQDALDIESLTLAKGERMLLRGPSGSGKSTFLSALSGVIDIPPGHVRISGHDLGHLSGSKRDRFRVDHIGLIFQMFNLIDWLSPLENVLLPCRFSRRRYDQAGPNPTATAQRLLAELGLSDERLHFAPSNELSVGQQQRVAAARALIGTPALILADEPTSALDDATKAQFIDLLERECRATGSALLFISHDKGLEKHFDRVEDMTQINRAYCSC